MPTKFSSGRVRQTYRFIEAHRKLYSIEAIYNLLEVALASCEAKQPRCPAGFPESDLSEGHGQKLIQAAEGVHVEITPARGNSVPP